MLAGAAIYLSCQVSYGGQKECKIAQVPGSNKTVNMGKGEKKRGQVNPPSQLNQDHLHGVFALPLGQAGQLPGVDDAVLGVDAGEVDLADELDGRGLVGVFLAAVHFEAVDAVFVGRLQVCRRLAFLICM